MDKNANIPNDFDLLKSNAQRDFATLVDKLEEINFRQATFLRALHTANPDPTRVSQHASILRDLYDDVTELLAIYCLKSK